MLSFFTTIWSQRVEILHEFELSVCVCVSAFFASYLFYWIVFIELHDDKDEGAGQGVLEQENL